MPREIARERWKRLVEECSSSGESVKDFCKRRGLSRWTFYEWRRRLRSARPSFLPVHVVAEASVPGPSGVEIRLRSGHGIRLECGFDPRTLAAALLALEGRPC